MKRILLTLPLFFVAGYAFTCSCAGPSTFCETITDAEGELWEALHVVQGTIVAQGEAGVRISVDRLWYGSSNRSEVFIRNGNSAGCTQSTDFWEVGDEFLLALDLTEDRDSFFLGICSTPWLSVEGGLARGAIAPGVDALPPGEILNLSGCGGLDRQLDLPALLYPNPTVQELRLELATEDTLSGVWEIYDVTGRLLLRESEAVLSDLSITLPNWPGGLYVLVIRTPYDRRAFRFVVRG